MFTYSHMLRHVSLGSVIIAGSLFLGGCMSVDRSAPFEEITQLLTADTGGDIKERVDPDTVNLWPLYTQNQDVRSILWPLVKSADDQFAIRPIYNYDHGVHDLFLGVISADFQRDEYRVFPIWWYFPEREFAFFLPIGGYGMIDGSHYVGAPLLYNHIWNPDTKSDFKQSLLYWRSTEDKHQEQGIFPFWWHTKYEDGSTEQTVFPLSHHVTDSKGKLLNWYSIPLLSHYAWESEDDFSYNALLYWRNAHGSYTSRGLFPFYYSSTHVNGDYTNSLLPLYWRSREGDEAYTNILGILYNYRKDEERTAYNALLYWQRTREHSSSRGLFPFYTSSTHDNGDYTNSVIPLYWRSSEGGDAYTNILGPLYNYWKEDDYTAYNALLYWQSTREHSTSRGLFPFYASDVHDNGDRTDRVFPLYWRSVEGETAYTNILGPLYNHWKDEDRTSYNVLLYWQDDQEDSHARGLFPFYTSDVQDNGDRTDRIFPLYWQSFKGDNAYINILGPLYNRRTYDGMTHELLFPVYYRTFSQDNYTFHTPFLGWGEDKERSYFYCFTAGNYKTPETDYDWMMPLYWRYQSKDQRNAGDYGFWTLLGGRTYETAGNRTRTWVLPFAGIWEYETSKVRGQSDNTTLATDLTIFPLMHRTHTPGYGTTSERNTLNIGFLLYRHNFSGDDASIFTPLLAWETDKERLTDLNGPLALYRYKHEVSEMTYGKDFQHDQSHSTYTRTRQSKSFAWRLFFHSESNKRSDSELINTNTHALLGLIYKNKSQRISLWSDEAPLDTQRYAFNVLGFYSSSSEINANYTIHNRSNLFGLAYDQSIEKYGLNTPDEGYKHDHKILFGLIYDNTQEAYNDGRSSKNETDILPLLYFNTHEISDHGRSSRKDLSIFPFYRNVQEIADEGASSKNNTSILPLLYFNIKEITDEGRSSREKLIASPFYYKAKEITDEGRLTKDTTIILPLLYANTHETSDHGRSSRKDLSIFPFYSKTKEITDEGRSTKNETRCLASLYSNTYETSDHGRSSLSSKFMLPFYFHTQEIEDEGQSSQSALTLFPFYRTTQTTNKKNHSAESETSILPWGVLYNRETLTLEQGTRTKTAFFGYLYRSQQDPDGATQQHIFPFIERHTLADGAEATSFLWRVWRREKTAAGTHRYHLFFIPFGG